MDARQADESRLRDVGGAFASLPQRYLGAPEDFKASYRIELEDLGVGWGSSWTGTAARCWPCPRPTPT
ncbi:MAG: hypothetical protein FJW90_09255 [Actinobacteria bacterium]|nr:hypothetical protein [Actinomycetota bacterium]